MSEAVIDVTGLTKRFHGHTVVESLDLRVDRGQIYGFLGPNGSGKTTTIRMLCGLLTPDGGGGTCLGYDITRDGRRIRDHLGYMTQRFSLYTDLTIRENLVFVARLHGIPGPRQAADEALARLGLTARARQLAGELSGGWKQRLALAACVLPNPELLLLDEPTAGVDPQARRDFWEQIHHLAADGMTVLVSTHYMDEAERCHEIAYLAYGRLLVHGPIDTVIQGCGLHAWTVSGDALGEVEQRLRTSEGVTMVAPFGRRLHVLGPDADALDAAVDGLRREWPDLHWQRDSPSLEDVFIHLMERSEDNFQ